MDGFGRRSHRRACHHRRRAGSRGALPGRQSAAAGPVETKVPPYYVALIASQPTSHYPVATVATVAAVPATSTGAVVASVTAPRPYALVSVTDPFNREIPERFFVLRINPDAPSGFGPLTADTILWTNNNGSKVIIADARPGYTLGVHSGGRYTALPWPARAVGAAW
jgi:hypothetical protein